MNNKTARTRYAERRADEIAYEMAQKPAPVWFLCGANTDFSNDVARRMWPVELK